MSALIADFVKSFRYTAQMVSIIGHASMLPVVEHSGYGDHLITPWKLDPVTLKFNVKGNIPYDKSLVERQTKLLRYVLEQPYSRDMVCSMLGLQKTVSLFDFFSSKIMYFVIYTNLYFRRTSTIV